MWEKSQQVTRLALSMGVSDNWYAFWQQPRTTIEKYQYAYWLTFYLYRDMKHLASLKGDSELVKQLDQAYYSGKWPVKLSLKK